MAPHGWAAETETSGPVDLSFNRDVRPILSDKCFFCHGPDDEHRAAGLRLDDAESALDSAIVPGDPDESELILRLLESDPELQMPPPESGKEINDAERAILRGWIEQGAKYEKHWAYVTPRRVIAELPVSQPSGVASEAGVIDRLVRHELARHPVEPSGRASKRDQIRRLTFDLTGLPPSYGDVQSFVENDSPAAYQRLVDQLLASPAFGERFAEYWLDLVRYADTVGYHGDQTHNIAPYRDYVIDSINDNLPLDRFSREQLAGDLLEDPTTEQQVASGYNRLLQTTHEGGLQPKEYIAIYAADRVRNVSAVWMAATMGCAQCHDHKYDPITAKDFYSMSAFFADVDDTSHLKNGTNALPTRREPELDVLGRTDRIRLKWAETELADAKAEGNQADVAALEIEYEAILARKRRTMVTRATEPREVRFLPRGNWLDESGQVMAPAVPATLGNIQTYARLEKGQRATRLDLARWLFDTERGIGGLTARVFANRLWYLYSGRGISPSLGDFGGQGQPPVNPDLLDHLAGVLVDSGWDLKQTVREIVTSETYRQAVVMDDRLRQVDPLNDLAASQSGHRLPAETVRDSLLEMSGLLDHGLGGRSCRPYQPEGYYRHLNFPQRSYQADQGAQQWRRGVYTHWQRQFLHPMLKALDAPSREECAADRPRSNTPLEALVLLNDPTFVIAAKAFAARVMQEASATGQRVDRMMQIAVGRDADAEEHSVLTDLYQSESSRFARDSQALEQAAKDGAAMDLGWPSSSSDVERAAWTSVARAVLNLHETLHRP